MPTSRDQAEASASTQYTSGTPHDRHEEKLSRLQAEVEALRAQLRRSPAETEDARDDELARLRRDTEALRIQLRQAQRLSLLGTMAAMVAHEFNNILTPVINYAQMARRNAGLIPKALERASEGGQRATEICRAILGFARGEAGDVERINLSRLAAETLTAMARDPAKDRIELIVEMPEDMTVQARRVEIQQVLLNLLLNARTAVLAGRGLRRIRLEASQTADETVLRIRDTGVGIPPDHLEKIFLPFFTTDQNEEDRDSHGLGLTVCREIIRSMEGSIEVDSSPGEGTCFTVRLPN